MKKFKRILASLVMVFTCIATLAGCGKDPAIESMSIKSGLQTIYYQGDTPSFDDLKVKVVYDDGTEKIIDKNELTIGNFSTESLGTYDVKIAYQGKEITVKIKVTDNKDEVYDIKAVENNMNFVQYNAALNPSSNAEFESVFSEREYNDLTIYKVGYDNKFVYNMNLTALDDNGEYIEGLKTTRTVTTVYVKDEIGDTYTKLEGNDVATYVEIDDYKSSYQFKPIAENKIFKLDIRPYYLKEEQLVNVANFTKTIEFKVVKGYNITEAKQLGILNNVNEIAEYTYSNSTEEYDDVNLYEKWTKFLNDNGIERADNTSAIILHNNIVVTGADVPSVLLAKPTTQTTNPNKTFPTAKPEVTNPKALYTDENNNKFVLEENLDGIKCDASNVYCHKIAKNDTFTIHGNFFTLDVDLPTVDTTLLYEYGSQTSLFRFVSDYSSIENEETTLADNNNAVAASTNTFVNINNLNSIGNAIRTDSTNKEKNEDSAQMGGLIFIKAPALTLNVRNSIIKAYLINFYIEERLSTINLRHVKSYDAYQSIVYGYNGGNMNIEDCFLERAGGPVILIANDDNDLAKKKVTTIVARRSKLESLVTGHEPWFDIYDKTTLATTLKATASTFETMFDSTFIAPDDASAANITREKGLVNAVFVNMSTDTYDPEDTYTSQSLAKLVIDDVVVSDTTGMNAATIQDANKALINEKTLALENVFETKKGGIVTSSEGNNASGFITQEDITDTGGNPDLLTQIAMGKWIEAMTALGDEYVGIYAFGMSMVTGYYSLTNGNSGQ